MPSLTPVEGNPFAQADDSGVPHITIHPKGSGDSKLTPVEGNPFADKASEDEDVKPDASLGGSMKRGFLEMGTGTDQLLNQIGVGGIIPVMVNGKISLGLPPNEELAKREKTLEKEGEGTGVTGFIGEQLGQAPLYMMPGLAKAGMMLKGGIQGALSAGIAPTTDSKQTLGDRAKDAAIAAPMSAAMGGALGKVGEKFVGKNVPAGGKMTDPGEAYKLAQKMGLKFTGKESPQEILNKVNAAVEGKVNELANGIAPGAANSSVWKIGTNIATSKMYAKALADNDKLYKQAQALGAKEVAPVEGLAADVKAQIDAMEKEAPYQAANPKFGTTINMLKTMYEHLTNGGEEAVKEDPWTKMQRLLAEGGEEKAPTVTGNQLIELDQALNENYGRTGGKGASGRALEALQNKVQTAIKGMSPEFSAAYDAAKKDFRQNIVQNFRENPTLAKYWTEDDYHAMQALGKGVKLPPALRARVDDMLGHIKTYNDLSELKNQLDPATYDRVRAGKFLQLMNDAGLDAKKLGDEKNYALLEKALGDKPQDLAMLNAIKTFNEEMTRRGISKDIPPVALQESDKRADRAFRTAFSFLTGHKVYGFRHAYELIAGDTPKGAKGRLTGLAEDVAKGAPKPVYQPGVIPNAASKAAATEEGKNADDQRELVGE